MHFTRTPGRPTSRSTSASPRRSPRVSPPEGAGLGARLPPRARSRRRCAGCGPTSRSASSSTSRSRRRRSTGCCRPAAELLRGHPRRRLRRLPHRRLLPPLPLVVPPRPRDRAGPRRRSSTTTGTIGIGVHPIGIDVRELPRDLARPRDAPRWRPSSRSATQGRQLVLGDRAARLHEGDPAEARRRSSGSSRRIPSGPRR